MWISKYPFLFVQLVWSSAWKKSVNFWGSTFLSVHLPGCSVPTLVSELQIAQRSDPGAGGSLSRDLWAIWIFQFCTEWVAHSGFRQLMWCPCASLSPAGVPGWKLIAVCSKMSWLNNFEEGNGMCSNIHHPCCAEPWRFIENSPSCIVFPIW